MQTIPPAKVMPRKRFTEKDEAKAEEIRKLVCHSKKYLTKNRLVSCPKKNFETSTLKVCNDCEFFIGLFPKDRSKKVSDENMWLLCQHPIARDVIKV